MDRLKRYEGYIYLASPYSHYDYNVKMVRYREITKIAANLLKEGIVTFPAITASHPIAEIGEVDGGWETWQKVDLRFLDKADALLVATMEGWAESVGVQAEIDYAKNKGLPVYYLNPATYYVSEDLDNYYITAVS